MGFNVSNKVVLVTGANRGIGKEIVAEALRRGAAKVYAAVRNVQTAEPLVAEHGEKVVPVRLDLSEESTVSAAAEEANDVDVVINNAGVLETASPLSGNAIEAMKREMDINVYGLLRVAQAFAPVLGQRTESGLAQLNSVASLKSFSDFATYSASKAASYSITQGLRDKLAAQGTKVVSVHPGPIATDMANDAGLGEIAEPPSLVAAAIFDAFEQDAFHAFPDSMAKQFGEVYSSFAKNIIESDLSES